MKKKLILLAHGSSAPKWRKPFESLNKRLQKKLGKECVCLAYLEKSKPNLMNIVKKASNEGVNSVHILPLFLSSGGHVDRDIPAQVQEVKKCFPKIKIKVLQAIGENTNVINVIYDLALESS